MAYQLTPEFIAGKWRQFWILNAILLMAPLFFMSVLMDRASVPGPQVCVVFIVALALWAPIAVFTFRGEKRKLAGELEVLSDRLRLPSSSKTLEINFKDISKVQIMSHGEVSSISIHSKTEPRLLVLTGYSDMTGLASDLERVIKDPGKCQRYDGPPPTRTRKLLGGLLGLSFVALFLLLGFGLFWLVIKIGLGPLALPLSFLVMGISNFASNRHNRQKRILGILMILGALALAAIKIFALAHLK
jgi:hypothetical protein